MNVSPSLNSPVWNDFEYEWNKHIYFTTVDNMVEASKLSLRVLIEVLFTNCMTNISCFKQRSRQHAGLRDSRIFSLGPAIFNYHVQDWSPLSQHVRAYGVMNIHSFITCSLLHGKSRWLPFSIWDLSVGQSNSGHSCYIFPDALIYLYP